MYNQREIVLVPFPYSDLSFSKRRPVVIISNNHYNKSFPDVLICVITSNLFKDFYSVDLDNENLESGILLEKSVIKCHKLFTIEQSKIIRRFSVISEEKFNEIINMMQRLINKSS